MSIQYRPLVQIKTFSGLALQTTEEEEDKINNWLRSQPRLVITRITRQRMFDTFPDGEVCNQWVDVIIEYMVRVVVSC